MTHTSGLSYGLFDPNALITKLYADAGVHNPLTPLSGMIDALEGLPLVFHPGRGWEYSVATDVLGRLVEVISGMSLDAFIHGPNFRTPWHGGYGFFCAPEKHDRLAAYYAGADFMNPMKPGLTRVGNAPYPGAFRQAVPRLSGSGLVSTLPDMVALVRSLLPDGKTLLKPETIALIKGNQLPDGRYLEFAGRARRGRGRSLLGRCGGNPVVDLAPQ